MKQDRLLTFRGMLGIFLAIDLLNATFSLDWRNPSWFSFGAEFFHGAIYSVLVVIALWLGFKTLSKLGTR